MFLLIGILILLAGCVPREPVPARLPHPNVRQLTRTYTHLANEFESEASARLIALAHVSRALAEEAARQIDAAPVSAALTLTREQLTTRMAGLLAPTIEQESWDGQKYWLRLSITLNMTHTAAVLRALHGEPYHLGLLQDMQQRTAQLLDDITRVKRQWLATGKEVEKVRLQQDYIGLLHVLERLHWQSQGMAAIYRRDYVTALIALSVYSELAPPEAVIYYFRAHAHLALGHTHQALEEVSRAIELHADEPTYYLLRVQVYLALEALQAALQDASAAIDLAPQLSLAYATRGAVYDRGGQHQQALQDYSQAITLAPQEPQHYIQRGLIYSALGEYTRAIDDFTAVITQQPQNAHAYYQRGKAYINLHKHAHAIADFTTALQIKVDFAEAYYQRGRSFQELGDYQHAIADFSRAVAANPPLADAYFSLAQAYIRLGEYPQGLTNFSQAAQHQSPQFLREVQRWLTYSGFAPALSTGALDSSTVEALRQYQAAHHLPTTGRLDDATIRALFDVSLTFPDP